MSSNFLVRRATTADLPALGKLGAMLIREHHAFDPKRFMQPRGDPEEGYAWFLGTQLQEADVAVFVAERNGAVIGYLYAGVEPLSWKELRDEAGFIHDIVVDPDNRRLGVGSVLIEAACDWFRSIGAPRVVLWTAEKNGKAQHLFESRGFRRTMIEMTRELK